MVIRLVSSMKNTYFFPIELQLTGVIQRKPGTRLSVTRLRQNEHKVKEEVEDLNYRLCTITVPNVGRHTINIFKVKVFDVLLFFC